MADPAHVAVFAQGPLAWNRWRAGRPAQVKFAGGRLVGRAESGPDGKPVAYDLSGLDLTGVELVGDLSHASFFKARLTEVAFRAVLAGADFRRAVLRRVDLTDAELAGCRFAAAQLACCSFDGARFARTAAKPGGGTEPAAEAGFENAVARRCGFRGVAFAGVTLTRCQFIDCDLRDATGLAFDENVLRGTLLSPYSDDDWSVLRRTYTGANMVFMLLASALFLLPWLLDALYWTGLNRLQAAASARAAAAAPLLAEAPVDPATRAVAGRLLAEALPPEAAACLAGEAPAGPAGKKRCFALWEVLLGWHEGLFAGLISGFLILYNVLRLGLTWLLAPLREEESRSFHTPPRTLRMPVRRDAGLPARAAALWPAVRRHYGWMLLPHRVFSWMLLGALVLGLYNLLPRAFERVWLP